MVMLHGAGGDARGGLKLLKPLADAAGLILLAPASRLPTWDVIFGGYGPDIAFIDSALTQTFSRYAVDPAQIAVGGFSDGASYALSVGITNGDLFTLVNSVLTRVYGTSWAAGEAATLYLARHTR